MVTINLNPPADYSQPTLPSWPGRGWLINSLDYQVVTKDHNWNQSQTKRLNEYQGGLDFGAQYAALACPYDDATKYGNYITDARTKGLKVWHRSHWNAWQGDNSVGSVTSITRSGTTATCTTSTSHLMATGNTVVIAGANQSQYNGEFTVTVTGATTFTYTISSDPGSSATGTITWRYGRQTYLDKTYDFIVANPTFFQAGDMFGMCVECNNADGSSSKNWTFRDTGLSSGSFSYTKYNQFLKEQITYANAAFTAIGLGGRIYTWPTSLSLSNLNLAGQELDSGNTGNSSGLTDADIVAYYGGILTIDHYMDNTYRSTDNYGALYSSDLDKIHAAFPSCQIMIGEWGYPTDTSLTDQEQYIVFQKVVSALESKSYVIGVNFWVHMGSSTASIFTDNSGTFVEYGRFTPDAMKRAFNEGNAAFTNRPIYNSASRPTSSTRPTSGTRSTSGTRTDV